MITSDAHEGIRKAISRVYPSVPWQRCQFHFSKNIADKAPKKYQAGLRTELTEMFNAKTEDEAYSVRKAVSSKATYQQWISSDLRSELKAIADNQRGMLAA